MKKLWNRQDLKSFFRKGQTPSQVHFEYLIDSMINKVDDGFAKTDDDGFRLAPTGNEQNVLSIFKHQSDAKPNWQLALNNDDNGNGTLSFDHLGEDDSGKHVRKSSLVLADDGQVGIGTDTPRTTLEISGVLGIRTRVGTFKTGQIPGDGHWHKIVEGLNDMHAFEVVARIDGPRKRGKYALAHAIALGAFGGGRNKIKSSCAYYGWFWNRIEFRWQGKEARNYGLEARTRSNYGLTASGKPYMLRFHISQLWDDLEFQELDISSNALEE